MGKDVKVLLVEDDEIDVLVVKKSFKKCGFENEVVVAKDGVVGLERLRDYFGDGAEQREPLIVLLDLNLPRMDGYEFLKELRKDEELRPVIVFILSTSDNRKDVEWAYEHNVAGYLVKGRFSDDPEGLGKLLSTYIEYSELPSK